MTNSFAILLAVAFACRKVPRQPYPSTSVTSTVETLAPPLVLLVEVSGIEPESDTDLQCFI